MAQLVDPAKADQPTDVYRPSSQNFYTLSLIDGDSQDKEKCNLEQPSNAGNRRKPEHKFEKIYQKVEPKLLNVQEEKN